MASLNIDARPYLNRDFEKALFEKMDKVMAEYELPKGHAAMVIVLGLSNREITQLSTPAKAHLIDSIVNFEGKLPHPKLEEVSIFSSEYWEKDLAIVDLASLLGMIPDFVIHEDFEKSTQADFIEADTALNRLYEHTRNGTYDANRNPIGYWGFLKELELIPILASDPVLSEARENWADYSTEQKRDTFQYLHGIHMQVFAASNDYGIKELPIKIEDTGDAGGYYNGDEIVIGDEGVENASFNWLLGAVLHEGRHHIDKSIQTALLEGRITPDDPLFFDAVIVARNYDDYHEPYVNGDVKKIDPSKVDHYLNNVTEQYARASAVIAKIAGILDPDTQKLADGLSDAELSEAQIISYLTPMALSETLLISDEHKSIAGNALSLLQHINSLSVAESLSRNPDAKIFEIDDETYNAVTQPEAKPAISSNPL